MLDPFVFEVMGIYFVADERLTTLRVLGAPTALTIHLQRARHIMILIINKRSRIFIYVTSNRWRVGNMQILRTPTSALSG